MKSDDYDKMMVLWLSTPGMGLNDLDDSKEGIHRFITRNPNTCFVVEKENKIVGTILCGHDGRRGYIYHLCVHVQYRRQGVASLLVDQVLLALKNERIHKVALVVFAHNEAGQQFWQNKGFTLRQDISYRNRAISQIERIDT